MWIGSELNPLCASANEESGPLAENTPLAGYDVLDDFHYSETTEIFFQAQSSDTAPSTFFSNGGRRRDHRQSALFTTVHLGARRTSGPKTSLSLFRSKFVASPVLVCLSRKYGETRA